MANTSVEVLSSGMCYFERVLWMKGGGRSGHEGDSIECSIFSTLRDLEFELKRCNEQEIGIGMMMKMSCSL